MLVKTVSASLTEEIYSFTLQRFSLSDDILGCKNVFRYSCYNKDQSGWDLIPVRLGNFEA